MYKTDRHIQRFLSDAEVLSNKLTRNDVDHEFILVANEPTDNELLVLKLLTAPFRVLYVEREPIYASWNRGVRESRGDFITFWGVDDTRFAQAIIDGQKKLVEFQADIVYFPFRYHRFVQFISFPILAKIKTFTPPEFEKGRFIKEMHLGPHFMVRRTLFEKIGYFDESFKIAGDYEFQARAAKEDAHFVRTLAISGIFRNDGTTLSGSRDELQAEENKRVLSSHI